MLIETETALGTTSPHADAHEQLLPESARIRQAPTHRWRPRLSGAVQESSILLQACYGR